MLAFGDDVRRDVEEIESAMRIERKEEHRKFKEEINEAISKLSDEMRAMKAARSWQ